MSNSFKTSILILAVFGLVLGCNQPASTDTSTVETTTSTAADTSTAAPSTTASASTVDANDLTNDKNKFGYALGAYLATQIDQVIGQQSGNLTSSEAIKGINDVLANNDLQMTDVEIQNTLQEGQAAMQAAQQAATEPTTEGGATPITGIDKDKFGYALGAFLAGQLGQVLAQQSENLNTAAAINGINDVLTKQEIKLSEEDIQSTLAAAQAAQQAEQDALSAENIAAGAAYLTANKSTDGWTETASGLQYKTVTEGTGASPTAEQTVKVHYKGTLIDGTQFDSSYDRNQPAEFPLNGVISGWTEGLQLMKVGGTTDFVIPSDMAYGPQGRPGIPANSVLLFTVELLEIK